MTGLIRHYDDTLPLHPGRSGIAEQAEFHEVPRHPPWSGSRQVRHNKIEEDCITAWLGKALRSDQRQTVYVTDSYLECRS